MPSRDSIDSAVRRFRRSTVADIDPIVRIAEAGKEFLRARGVSQWQRGTYPDRDLFLRDIRDGIGYVVSEGDSVLAVCAVTGTDEVSYRALRSGRWLSPPNVRYATIHRCAVAPERRGEGIAGFVFASVLDMARRNGWASVRIDTHPDNAAMQAALGKAGFSRCGELVLLDGDECGDLRFGYERCV